MVLATAELNLPVTADADAKRLPTAITLEALALTAGFTSAVTWNTKDGTNSWTGGAGALGQAETTAAGSRTLPTASTTGLGGSGRTGNFGVLVKSTSESTLRRLTVNALTATAPARTACDIHLEVSYLERFGAYQGSQFFDTTLTDSSTLQVNLATGNAVLTANDLGLSRTCNSQGAARSTSSGPAGPLTPAATCSPTGTPTAPADASPARLRGLPGVARGS